METLTLKTDIHCEGCVNSIKPLLDGDSGIKNWEVDLVPEVKTLTVQGDEISSAHVNQLLNQAGYNVVDAAGVVSNEGPFWGDLKLFF